MVTITIKESLKKILKDLGIDSIEPQVEQPADASHGDYSTNIALVAAKRLDKKPREIAEQIKGEMENGKWKMENIDRIEVAGVGFINFWIAREELVKSLTRQPGEATTEQGRSRGKKIMVEFAHPNTHKQFHIGHLRNITTGEALCRLLSSVGVRVIRANYQGDVGMHIAKALYGIEKLGFSEAGDVKERMIFLGKAYVEGATAYEDNEDAKKAIQTINKKIYEKTDPRINELYKTTRQWSLDYFEQIYKRVGTTFDRYYFESEVYESGKAIAFQAFKDGILEKSDGAIIFPGEKFGSHDRVFITSEGLPTYEAKDLGLAKFQFEEHKPDMVIHVLGPEQLGYTQVLFKALQFIQPETQGKELHLPYGWVKLKEGKMASRTGNVVLGEWLLDEVKKAIISQYDSKAEIAEQVAVGAIKYSFLKVGVNQTIAFDIKESISLEGNSGPYLQYVFARTQSVLRKASMKYEVGSMKYDMQAEELLLLRMLYKFEEVVISSAEKYAPNILCNYLFELAQLFNVFYQKHSILNSESETRDFRLALTAATGNTIKSGLHLLGIQSPEKM